MLKKIARGISVLVRRYLKAHKIKVMITKIYDPGCTPAPREQSTLTSLEANGRAILLGGVNYEKITEAAMVRSEKTLEINWEQLDYAEQGKEIIGRIGHSSVCYGNKIYTFGGGFMYNRKRQMRECLNETWTLDMALNEAQVLKTDGCLVFPRKN
jgi:hypothetical protein